MNYIFEVFKFYVEKIIFFLLFNLKEKIDIDI